MDVEKAQNIISETLKALEESTGLIVSSVSIDEIDITCISDSKRKLVRRARVQLEMEEERRW
jgi:hypothetical protein